MKNRLAYNELYNRITQLIEQSRHRVMQSVNLTMVYTYDEIGRYIVEDEQKGEQRAEYGKAVLKEVMRLANEGQRIEKSADLLKNPFILEFLGLEEKSVYTEPVFETRILSNLQKFLLEMGKVFCLKPDKNALLSTKTVFMLIWCCITVCCNVMFL